MTVRSPCDVSTISKLIISCLFHFNICLQAIHSVWPHMDPVQFADGSSLIRASRVCFHDKIVWSAIQICTYREMHMHFQHIKCWLDKGFNKLDKINKKSRYFFLWFMTLGFAFKYYILLQGIKYIFLVVKRRDLFEHWNLNEWMSCADPGIFVRGGGGGPGQSYKKSSRGGPTFSRGGGGSNFFQGEI